MPGGLFLSDDAYHIAPATNAYRLQQPTQGTVIEDFESGSIYVYGGDVNSFRAQSSNVLQGAHSLESTGTNAAIADHGGDIPTPRTVDGSGVEYRARVFSVDAGDAGLMTNIQRQASPLYAGYRVRIDTTDNRLILERMAAGAVDVIDQASVTLSSGQEYRPAISMDGSVIRGLVYDRSGGQLAATDTHRESSHTGGGLGWWNGAGTTTFYDLATRTDPSLTQPATMMIDDFEDGDLREYEAPASSGSQYLSQSAAYRGQYGLVVDDYGSIFSRPGMGLDQYIPDGRTIAIHHQFQVAGGGEQYYFFISPQSTSAIRPGGYRIEFLMSGMIRLRKDGSTMTGSSTNDPDYAEARDLSLETGTWYRTEVLPDSSGDILRADVYDLNTESLVAFVEGEDGEYIGSENGFGAYSSGGGQLFVDEIRETM